MTLLQNLLTRQEWEQAKAAKIEREAEKAALPKTAWPNEYINAERHRPYKPHHDDEARAVLALAPRYQLFKGGEGGGKSVAGIVKSLNRLRLGVDGIMVSPDFEHFKKSLWPEFRRWCPWNCVVEKQRYRGRLDWEPHGPFALTFVTGATLYCGGIEEPMSWEGPNVGFAHFDEARRAKNADALKVLDGRVRIPGPNGEPPQLWLTTTPRKNWLFEYFGGPRPPAPDDTRAAFKSDAQVITLKVIDNELAGNLQEGYTRQRRQSLTEQEARVLLEAEWEDIDEAERFLPSIIWWDNLREQLPALTRNEAMVIAMDAATGRTDSVSDCFGMLGVTRHPTRHNDVAVRFAQKWQAKPGQKIDFQGTEAQPGPELILRRLCKQFNVACVVYDPTQLHDMAGRLRREGLAWFEEFPQGEGTQKRPGRGISDKHLLDLITNRRLAHDGNADLRTHIDNANRKVDPNDRKLRIVKREESLKIDLAICLSQGSLEVLRLNL